MELFYSADVCDGIVRLDSEESAHCVRVMRHRAGDEVFVADGAGTMYRCTLLNASAQAAELQIKESFPGWHSRPYRLTMAVCPTKNPDRYEWFAEKATEMGVDEIIPVIAGHSERRVFKTERLRRILLSAAKQSLKSSVPVLREPTPLSELLTSGFGPRLRLMAYCFEDESHPRISITEALRGFDGTDITVLIGPEGDFSEAEVRAALDAGFVPVHLGDSRLRTETAALTSVAAVYLHHIR